MARLVLTPGDPTGIGPEVTLKALNSFAFGPRHEITVVGSLKALEETALRLELQLPKSPSITYHAIEDELPGKISYRSLEAAATLIRDGKAISLVTGPISKANLRSADIHYPGHTEILEFFARDLFSAKNAKAEMLFVFKSFRLLLLTRHIALSEVSEALKKPGAISGPLKTLIAFLRHDLDISEPRIALLGVNPHAGEMAGDEEKLAYMPVIHAVNGIGASRLEGPFPADAFFRGFSADAPKYDAVVAAYHDQGLIPFKLLAGYDAVNVTLGLPFLRTSVSHGTAEDIAQKGIADPRSMLAALQLAFDWQ